MQASVELPAPGWAATLELEILRAGDRSELGRRRHFGPLRVQRAFHPDGATPHVYVLHPPGGMVGGDVTDVRVHVRQGASALVTTPAAQKLYRSAGAFSVARVALDVAPGGSLEWFPGETIAFDGARSRQDTAVSLDAGAAFLGWEMGCFGRPASGLSFRRGEVSVAFSLSREGAPLVVERQRVQGGDASLAAAWGFAGLPVWGVLYAVPREPATAEVLVDLLRSTALARCSGTTDERVAATSVDGVVIVRVLGLQVDHVRARLVQAWSALRPAMLGRAAVAPRIWST